MTLFGVITCPECSHQMAVPQVLPTVGVSQTYVVGSGHCRHCEGGCTGAEGGLSHRDGIGGTWRWRCPACAEAERIAEAIDAEVAKLDQATEWSEGREVDGLLRAAKIARGEV